MSEHASTSGRGPSQRGFEIGTAAAMAVFSGIVLYGSWLAGIGWGAEGPRAGFFPFYVAAILLLASIINIGRVLAAGDVGLFAEWPQLRQVGAVILPTAVYVISIPWTGLYLASMLLIALFMRWLGGYRWVVILGVAVGVPVLAYIMFEKWFMVPLPKGPIEDLLGL